jgi:hypothetical protein
VDVCGGRSVVAHRQLSPGRTQIMYDDDLSVAWGATVFVELISIHHGGTQL